jgi:hypothetical protein
MWYQCILTLLLNTVFKSSMNGLWILKDDLLSDFPLPLFLKVLEIVMSENIFQFDDFFLSRRRYSNGDKHCCPLCYCLLWLSWKDYLDSPIQCLFSILQMICWQYLWHLDRHISQVGALQTHVPFQEPLLESNWSCLKGWFSWFDFGNQEWAYHYQDVWETNKSVSLHPSDFCPFPWSA